MCRGLPGRMHHRRSAAHRNEPAVAGQIPNPDWRDSQVKRSIAVALLFVACAVGADAAAAEKSGHAAIASAHKLATDAGFEVIAAGGNAFDAAIAVAAALSVVEPHSSGIGGGGFFLLHRASDGKDIMVDA